VTATKARMTAGLIRRNAVRRQSKKARPPKEPRLSSPASASLERLGRSFYFHAMESGLDMLSACRAGAILRTRDRRAARIDHAEPGTGLIHGEVEMHGPCVWHADGRYRDAPFGAPGPLDLMPPESAAPPAAGQPRISIEEALAADHRLFCCD
jgi:hypothetical protein